MSVRWNAEDDYLSMQSSIVKTGSLGHLSPNQVLWTPCTAALNPPYLTLTPKSTSSPASGQYRPSDSTTPVTRLFDLTTCSNARSISIDRLGPHAAHPLVSPDDNRQPGHIEGDEAHVFEVELDGGVKEYFSANTTKDRGAWVSAIWDIILARQDLPSPSGSPRGTLGLGSDVEGNSTGTPVLNILDSRLDPPLRVMNGAASRLSGLSSNEPSMIGELGQTFPLSRFTLSSPDSSATIKPSPHISDSVSPRSTAFVSNSDACLAPPSRTSSRLQSPSQQSSDLTDSRLATSSYQDVWSSSSPIILDSDRLSEYTDITSPISAPSGLITSPQLEDEELPYPTPPHPPSLTSTSPLSGKGGSDASFRRVALKDGDDAVESWRPEVSPTNTNISPAPVKTPNDTPRSIDVYKNLPPSGTVVNPFARRRSLKNGTTSSPSPTGGPLTRAELFSSAQSPFDSTPSTLTTPRFVSPPADSITRPTRVYPSAPRPLELPAPTKNAPEVLFGGLDTAETTAPDPHIKPPGREPRPPSPPRPSEPREVMKIDEALAMLDQLIHLSTESAHSSASATGALGLKLEDLMQLVQSLSVLQKSHDASAAPPSLRRSPVIETFHNISARRSETADLSQDLVLAKLDDISRQLMETSPPRRSPSPVFDTSTILQKLDELKELQAQPALPLPSDGPPLGADINQLSDIHVKLNALMQLCRRTAENSNPGTDLVSAEYAPDSLDPDDATPSIRSPSVFSRRGSQRSQRSPQVSSNKP